jgi:uncharacterized membrane protein
LSDASLAASRYTRSESRISLLTIVLGLLAGLPVAYFRGWRWGFGIVIGSLLAWFNFRWLKQGLDALTEAAKAQSDQPIARVPVRTYFTAMFRYGLIALTVYVIFRYLSVPLLSMILGLCALGAATVLASVHEVMHSPD